MVLRFLLVASSRNNGTIYISLFYFTQWPDEGLWEQDGTGHEGLCFGFGSICSHISLFRFN